LRTKNPRSSRGARILASIGIKELEKLFYQLSNWIEMQKEKAKLEAAEKTAKEDLKKAGDDEQAQKDAIDKLFDSIK
jgi:glycine cleavage system pyridoxal-binding protein P